jgi:hypothetical protein
MGKSLYYIADFDSTSSVILSLANFLHGRGFNSGGIVPNTPKFVAELINSIPEDTRKGIYKWSGWYDAVSPEELKDFREDKLSELLTGQYPKKKYPGVMIGSSNGAGAYLCAALGIPFLPQTFLLPVRRIIQPDNLVEDMEWGKEYARILLENNPGLQIHQMHDPVQDRLMVERMAYFRIKKLNLGGWYKNFIRSFVENGSTLFTIECNLTWPVTKISDRYYFQAGGLGALSPGELSESKPEIEKFLKQEGSSLDKWNVPDITANKPEAEWGFVDDLLTDIEYIVKEKEMNICQIVFEKPDDLSAMAADLYRWWYTRLCMDPNRLIAECFALLDHGALKDLAAFPTGSPSTPIPRLKVLMNILKIPVRLLMKYLSS